MQVASFLLYLTDVPEGGETTFPFEVKSSLSLHLDSHIISHFLVTRTLVIRAYYCVEWIEHGR